MKKFCWLTTALSKDGTHCTKVSCWHGFVEPRSSCLQWSICRPECSWQKEQGQLQLLPSTSTPNTDKF